MQCNAIWLSTPVYGFFVLHSEGVLDECLIGCLVFSCCKRENIESISGLACIHMDRICCAIWFYLSPEGLEFMTQSKYSLAAKESSTLFTSLVKLPSTCLLLNASALLFVSDLNMYDIMCHLS